MNKVKVRIIGTDPECSLQYGDIGYIDGYLRGGNNVPYIVVVVGKKVDMVTFHNLEVLEEE